MTKRIEDGRQETEDRKRAENSINFLWPFPNLSLFGFRLHSSAFRFLPSVLCLLSSILISCENDPGLVNELNNRKPAVEQALNIESFLSQNGRLKAKLTAPLMWRYALDTSYLEFPKTLHVNFYDSTVKVESQVDALYGKYFESRAQVYLRDSVVVFNIKGDTLRAPELWWDQNTRKFYTDKFVTIKRKGQQFVGGKGLDAKQDLSDVIIYQLESPSFITVPDSMKMQ